MSWSRIWQSSEAEAKTWESGEKHNARIGIAWPIFHEKQTIIKIELFSFVPSTVCKSFPVATSKILTKPFCDPHASNLPSGL